MPTIVPVSPGNAWERPPYHLHWAGEASLDVLSRLARRLDGVPVQMVGTYRDDELGATHPLRIVLGELATSDVVTRMKLNALSPAGVASLVGSGSVDTDASTAVRAETRFSPPRSSPRARTKSR